MANKEVTARIRINKLLEAVGSQRTTLTCKPIPDIVAPRVHVDSFLTDPCGEKCRGTRQVTLNDLIPGKD